VRARGGGVWACGGRAIPDGMTMERSGVVKKDVLIGPVYTSRGCLPGSVNCPMS
jgi:hypothetical protein